MTIAIKIKLVIAGSVFCLATTIFASKNIPQTPSLKTDKAIVNYAVKDIKDCLNNPEGKLSTICCTYKFNGTKVISKEIKRHFNGYRVKPAYQKKSFLNEETNHPDKIVQVQFNKHSDKLLITYKDPQDKGRKIYSESVDASKYNFV